MLQTLTWHCVTRSCDFSKDTPLQDGTAFSDCGECNDQQREWKNLGRDRGAGMRVFCATGAHPKPKLWSKSRTELWELQWPPEYCSWNRDSCPCSMAWLAWTGDRMGWGLASPCNCRASALTQLRGIWGTRKEHILHSCCSPERFSLSQAQLVSRHENSRAWCIDGDWTRRQCLVHKCTEGAGRGPNKCMSWIIQGLTELLRLSQAHNNTKMHLAGQQSLHLWTSTNYFDQHLVRMWTDCYLWKHSSVALLTPSDQLFR